jgi:hypothetical protein
VPEVGASSELKDEAEGLKREAERQTDMSERKKRKWEEENDSSASDNKIAVIIIFLYLWGMLCCVTNTVILELCLWSGWGQGDVIRLLSLWHQMSHIPVM